MLFLKKYSENILIKIFLVEIAASTSFISANNDTSITNYRKCTGKKLESQYITKENITQTSKRNDFQKPSCKSNSNNSYINGTIDTFISSKN